MTDGHVLLPGGAELGPPAGDPIVEADVPPLDEEEQASRGDRLHDREGVDDGVARPGSSRRVGRASDEVDDGTPVDDHAEGCTDLAAMGESRGERVGNGREGRIDVSTGPRDRHPGCLPDSRVVSCRSRARRPRSADRDPRGAPVSAAAARRARERTGTVACACTPFRLSRISHASGCPYRYDRAVRITCSSIDVVRMSGHGRSSSRCRCLSITLSSMPHGSPASTAADRCLASTARRTVSGLSRAARRDPAEYAREAVAAGAALLALPLAGLVLLLVEPDADAHWQHRPTHFWLILGTALVNVVLGLAASEAARRRRDARAALVSLAFLASAGFLALHALATPGTARRREEHGLRHRDARRARDRRLFAAASALELSPAQAAAVLGRERLLRGRAVRAARAVGGRVAGRPPASRPTAMHRRTTAPALVVVAAAGCALYGFATTRYVELYRRRRDLLAGGDRGGMGAARRGARSDRARAELAVCRGGSGT